MLIEFSSPLSLKQLQELLGVEPSALNDLETVLCTHLTCDSREVGPNTVFVAYKGIDGDGHAYLESAVEKGASAVVLEDSERAPDGVPALIVEDGRYAFSALCARATNEPTKEMVTVGITGTNGKTTTLWLVSQLLERFENSVLQMGTLGVNFKDDQVLGVDTTTPPSDVIHSAARKALDHGGTACVMEVSSHGLHQHRTAHVYFDAAVFTNLSLDHLHYHKDMEDYFLQKKRLFEQAFAENSDTPFVIGVDDEYGQRLATWCEEQGARYTTYGLSENAMVQVAELELSSEGVAATLIEADKRSSLRSLLIGEYNALNATAAFLVLRGLGFDDQEVLAALSEVQPPCGRMERFDYNGAIIFVDYAHTADGLEKALSALRPITKGKLWVMFGAGGSKDPGKRPAMGKVAKRLADHAVLTADNPKTVPVATINEQIMASGLEPTLIEDDRGAAIYQTIKMLEPGDVLIIAGKGQENYQIIGTETFTYTDQGEVTKAINELSSIAV